jgi:hypothetical protein
MAGNKYNREVDAQFSQLRLEVEPADARKTDIED